LDDDKAPGEHIRMMTAICPTITQAGPRNTTMGRDKKVVSAWHYSAHISDASDIRLTTAEGDFP